MRSDVGVVCVADFGRNVCVKSVCAIVAIGVCALKMSVAFFVIESALLEVNMRGIFAFVVIAQVEYVLEVLGALSDFLLWLSAPPKPVTTYICTEATRD